MLSDITDRLLRRRIQKDEKEVKIGFTVSALIILALLANAVFLNLYVLKLNEKKTPEPIAVVSPSTPSPSPSQLPVPSSAALAPAVSQTPPSPALRDYFINLGSGFNQSTDWLDVPGTLMTFDIGQYKNVKEVHLETTLSVQTENGTVSVRLFNKTDGYAVWNSDRTVQARASMPLLISQGIIYPQGPKLYSVQMMTQLGVLANLLQARLHVVAQ